MERVYNFSAGPSMLPESTLMKAQAEMLCYGKTGMSVMEMSHRSRAYEDIIFGAEETLRNHGDTSQLQGSVPSRRCFKPVFNGSFKLIHKKQKG